jgi:energy-coupling factor transport system substrate-specific component
MRSALRMWNNTRMIILVAVCSAIYGSALIAFKTVIPLIPGYTEVRVANVFPMVFSLLFGPAGAWGSAIGNLIGDLFGGTLGPGSLPGFVGNFILGYLPYTLWTTLLPGLGMPREWTPGRWLSWVNYVLIAFISSAACAVLISTGVDALGMVPYTVLSKIISLNNTFGSLIGLILLVSVFTITKLQLGLFWVDLMDEKDVRTSFTAVAGAWIVAAASVIGLFGALVTGLQPATVGWLCSLGIIVGSLLL